jgi:hypothetical protein
MLAFLEVAISARFGPEKIVPRSILVRGTFAVRKKMLSLGDQCCDRRRQTSAQDVSITVLAVVIWSVIMSPSTP